MASQTNPRSRFIINNIATRIFTFFGLLILVAFTALIIHLLYNAMPLVQSPDIKFVNSYDTQDFDLYLGTTISGGQAVSIGIKDCDLMRQSLENDRINDAIRLSCNKHWLPVNNSTAEIVLASIDSEGLVEFYRVKMSEQVFDIQIFNSFYVPALQNSPSKSYEKTTSSGTLADRWVVEIFEQRAHLAALTKNGTSTFIDKSLNSLEQPNEMQFGAVINYFPLAISNYLLLKTESKTVILDSTATAVQTIDASKSDSILRFPNARGFFVFDDLGFTVYGLTNVSGIFRYVELVRHDLQIEGSPISIDFDRQTGAFFVLTDASNLFVLNPNTFEVVSSHVLSGQGKSFKSIEQFLLVNDGEKVFQYETSNMVGVTTWDSLFEPIQYIGYQEAEYIWQTSRVSSSDQAKYNVLPLIIGSIKASLLALIVAVPLAVGSAIFTAYFATEKARAWLKPSIEMVEAMPTVVIGFIAAVWLAPMADKNLIALLLLVITLPFLVIVSVFAHSYWSMRQVNFQSHRKFLFWAVLLLLALVYVLFSAGVLLQDFFINSNTAWASELMATVSLSKSAVVVALALGVAITPSIYSLIDDAINEVPKGAIWASFSLGANEVQTLFRVVLIVALPGILSAIMLGFGRAFGETMIVLMVTGNTPMPSWDLLDGLRTLTSNLTIELQESNEGSLHFHILFFTAALLFLFTFCINSFAALLKNRLNNSLVYGANDEQ